MTDPIAGEDRCPMSSEDDDAQVAGVLIGHDTPSYRVRPPLRFFTADRRVVIAVAVAVACFSAAVLVAIVSQYRTAATQRSTIAAQVEVISAQDKTIDVERSRSAQIERQASDLQSQVSDQQNQTLCRSQIANDFESLNTQLLLTRGDQDQLVRSAIVAILNGDRAGFAADLDQAASLDPQLADLEPKVAAAAQARQESVATCQKAASQTPATTTPGG